MELSILLTLLTAVFALSALIISIIILSKQKHLDKSDEFGDIKELINNGLYQQRKEINDRLDSSADSINNGLNTGLSNITRSQSDNMREVREVITERLTAFENTMSKNNFLLNSRMEDMRKGQDIKLDAIKDTTANKLNEISESTNKGLNQGLEKMGKTLNDRLSSFEHTMVQNNETLDRRLDIMRRSQEESLEKVRTATESRLTELKDANQKKLEEIQGTVAEKLDKTLTERVSESFKNVSDQLEKVYKGLGEMQSLASDVGSLKNALTNVKVRGEMGEIQLGRILEQTFAAEQYSENVITKKGSKDPVEFAVKIPSKDTDTDFIYLPIDAKFPLDTYNALCEAYDLGDKAKIDLARKALYTRVKTDAINIKEKYIQAPETTDFGIMFLPTEGLFAEIIRNAELTERLRTEYKVTVCGPSTITAFLNSLQMGFRTLTYEKKSSQIARTLSEVKTEFGKFGDSLSKVQKSIDATGKELDTLVGTRTRAINRKLKNIDELKEGEPLIYLAQDDE